MAGGGGSAPITIETDVVLTSNDIVESIDFRVGYTATGAQRGQRRKPFYDSIGQFVASNVLWKKRRSCSVIRFEKERTH